MAVIASRSTPISVPRWTLRLEPLVLALAVASAIELLILRTFTRTAIHIPALEQLAKPYEAVSLFGRYSYYVAALLLVMALPVAAHALWREGDKGARAASLAVAGFAISAAIARVAGSSLAVDLLTVAAVAGTAAAAAGRLEWRAGLAVMVFTLGSVLIGGYSLLQTAVGEGANEVDARVLLYAGEAIALAFALASPWMFRAVPGRRAFIVAVVVGVVTFGMLLGNASTVKILLLWNEGLSGPYPSFFYAAGASALLATVAGLLAHGQRLTAVGFALLIIGGFGLHSTYQTGLVIAGLATLALALPRPGLAAASARPREER